eukprot:CAMPEP_0185364538 /NCGR_PEP_ID=MMETSP1364-20130426/12459_1 /TAXON_ID=38817 /ORGANISM="Gephyrocapsa oceanica, Strain RCC1303" /LENGTH=201 /DNA_ID=CAMNT_0027965035 /DNA_START=94 /DNA_END=697 /DNA_ORIENTATION=-
MAVLPSGQGAAASHRCATAPPGSARGEGPVDADGRAHEGGPVHLIDGALRVLLLLVLHQGVALDETGAPVEVEVQVLDVADVAEGVVQVVLGRLLMQVGHKDNPALDDLAGPLMLPPLPSMLSYSPPSSCIVCVLPAAPRPFILRPAASRTAPFDEPPASGSLAISSASPKSTSSPSIAAGSESLERCLRGGGAKDGERAG